MHRTDITASPILLLQNHGFSPEKVNLKVSHNLSIVVLADKPKVAYVRMDSVMKEVFETSNMRDIVAQLSGRGVSGIVYDFENFSSGESIRFALSNILPAERGFDVERLCFAPSFEKDFDREYIVPYFGCASREADRWMHGDLKNVINRMIGKVYGH